MGSITSVFGGTLPANFTSASYVPVTTESYTATGNDVNLSLAFLPPPGTQLTLVHVTGEAAVIGEFANLQHGQKVEIPFGGLN